jgi:hypothetical protein
MTHARIPDFSASPAALAVSSRVLTSDPVLAAIDAHAEAWAVFQIADAGRPSEVAEDAMCVALEDLLATPCSSHFGALALIRHLRWLIREEAITADADDVLGRLVLVREADLSRFMARHGRVRYSAAAGAMAQPALGGGAPRCPASRPRCRRSGSAADSEALGIRPRGHERLARDAGVAGGRAGASADARASGPRRGLISRNRGFEPSPARKSSLRPTHRAVG